MFLWVSSSLILFLEIELARFADSRVMLLPEVLYTAHPDFDVFSKDWALHPSIDDCKTLRKTMPKASKSSFTYSSW